MGRPLDDEDEALELPAALDGDDETTGLADVEDLALADIGEGPEEVGLDTEAQGLDISEMLVDAEEEELASEDEGTHDELVAEVDAEGDEGGWLEENEGANEVAWEDDLFQEEDEDAHDDGGLEGVDDPMLDGLVSDEEPRGDDEDDTLVDDLGDDLLREIAQDG